MGTIIAVTAAAGMEDRAGAWPYLFRRGTDRTVSVLLSFAAGMMLAVVCADLLTDAIQAGQGSPRFLRHLPAYRRAAGDLAPGGAGKRAAGELPAAGRALFCRCGDGAAIALHNLPGGW